MLLDLLFFNNSRSLPAPLQATAVQVVIRSKDHKSIFKLTLLAAGIINYEVACYHKNVLQQARLRTLYLALCFYNLQESGTRMRSTDAIAFYWLLLW